jgi:hypothetical protein
MSDMLQLVVKFRQPHNTKWADMFGSLLTRGHLKPFDPFLAAIVPAIVFPISYDTDLEWII